MLYFAAAFACLFFSSSAHDTMFTLGCLLKTWDLLDTQVLNSPLIILMILHLCVCVCLSNIAAFQMCDLNGELLSRVDLTASI